MTTRISRKIIIIFFFVFSSMAFGDEDNTNRIEVMVNENIITKYDIIQRIKINSILRRIEISEDNHSQLIQAVVDDLVVEILKNKKINEYNISFNEQEFQKHEIRFYSNINYEKEELRELFSINNINYNYLLDFIEIELK